MDAKSRIQFMEYNDGTIDGGEKIRKKGKNGTERNETKWNGTEKTSLNIVSRSH